MPLLNRTWKGRRLLAIDGGGPCHGMTTIILMEELMRLMQRELGQPELPRPGEVFDLMVGSGMGGLLAIMWGRLMMTIEESKKYFNEISSEVFSEKKRTAASNTMFKASKLEDAARKMLTEYLGNENARMNDPHSSSETCKTFVCVTPTATIRAGMVEFLRSYPATQRPGPDCSIVEAIRATCASVGLLKPVKILEPGNITTSYMDGGINNNNPTPRLLEEAGLVFPAQDVVCVINLGAGRPRTISAPDFGSPNFSWSSELSTMLMALATDCERTAQEMETRFAHIPEVYFRFSVDQGLEDITLWDWEKNVVSHTHAYLRLLDNSTKINRAAQVLVKDEMKVPVERIAGSIPASTTAKYTIKRCPPPSHAFVGRKEILEQMENYFFADRPTEQLLFILHGLGGSGKSQVAYKFVDLHKNRFSEVVFVDATSEETIKADLKILAAAKKAGDGSDDALSWLAVQSQNWLMVFNNADNTSLNLRRFFPSCSHGSIVVTTRNRQMIVMAQKEAHHQVSGLSCEDALQLLLKISEAKGEVQVAGTALVEELGYFALAIVQAAAYIRVHECSIHEYHEMYEKSRGSLLEEYKDCIPKVDDYEQTAYATWHACHKCLSPTASRLFSIFAFMHHSDISEDILQRALSSPLGEVFFSHGDSSGLFFQDLLNDFTVGGIWSKRLFLACIQELRSYSLVDFDPLTHQYSIHPLSQQWARSTSQNIEDMNQLVALLLASSLCLCSPPSSCYSNIIVRHIDALLEIPIDGHSLWAIFAHAYLAAGRHKEAEDLEQQNLSYSKARFGDYNPVALKAEEQLAMIHWAQGRSQGAEVVSARLRLVELYTEMLGDNGIATMAAKEMLALTYAQQGRWPDAEKTQMEVLEAYTNNLGAIDPSTRAARWSLVQIYLSQGKLEDVAKISGEVEKDRNLEILKTDELGKLQLLLLKAQIDAERGRWDKAARLQEEILELSIQLHGEKDAKTLNAQKTLSEILLNIPSRPAKTEVPAKRVVKSHKRKFDGKDPVARPAKRHLPVPRELAGCFVEFVGAVLQEALEAGEQELEPTHPENLKVRLSLGTNLMQQDRWPEARKILTLTEELEQALRAQPELHLQFLAVHGMLGCQDDEIASFVETLPAHYIFHNRDDTDHVQ